MSFDPLSMGRMQTDEENGIYTLMGSLGEILFKFYVIEPFTTIVEFL